MKKPLRKYAGSRPYFLGCMGVAVVLCIVITYFALNYLVLVFENKLSVWYESSLRREQKDFESFYFKRINEEIHGTAVRYSESGEVIAEEYTIVMDRTEFEKELSDLLLLDIMLPGLDGFALMREIRKTSDIPVIFLTARVSLSDRLYGYELGCDDYICKPFLVEELCAKIKNLLKRTRKEDKDRILTCGDITLDRRTLRVTSDGMEVELPPKEYGILLQLMQNADTVLTRDQLMDLVWGMDSFCTDRVVDNHVKNLRKLLGSSGKKIKSVYGRGYKITPA